MPKIYTVMLDGKPCTMTNNSGMTREEAERYCRDKFPGEGRFGGFVDG